MLICFSSRRFRACIAEPHFTARVPTKPRPVATLCFRINFKRRLRVRGYFRAAASSYPAVVTSRSDYTTAGELKTGTLSHFQVIYNYPRSLQCGKEGKGADEMNKAVGLLLASISSAPVLSGQNRHQHVTR